MTGNAHIREALISAIVLLASACSRAPLRDAADASPGDAALNDGAPPTELPRADALPGDAPAKDAAADGPPPVVPRPLGASCAAPLECESGFCAGGVCCDAPCEGPCLSCAATGRCAPLATGTACGGGACLDEETQVVSRTCDGLGTCVVGATMACDPFACDPESNACRSTCTSNLHCAANRRCSEGTCIQPGRPRCASNAECESGFCADGVCCNVACTGPCVACNLPGHQGTCWPIDKGGADPHGVCLPQAATTCGNTGTCDGVGGCDRYPRGTVCAPARCEENTLIAYGVCDGAGSCAPGASFSCVPYRCKNDRCVTLCATDDDCATGRPCISGMCGRPRPGFPCSSSSECASGFCAQGVCCDSACASRCTSCALPGTIGTCTPVPSPDAGAGCLPTSPASP